MKDTQHIPFITGDELCTSTIPFPHSFEFRDVFKAFEKPSGPFASSEIVLNQNIASFMGGIVERLNRFAVDHHCPVMVAVDMQWGIDFTFDGPIETVSPVLRITGRKQDNNKILTADVPGLGEHCALTGPAETLASLVIADERTKPVLLSIAALYIADVCSTFDSNAPLTRHYSGPRYTVR